MNINVTVIVVYSGQPQTVHRPGRRRIWLEQVLCRLGCASGLSFLLLSPLWAQTSAMPPLSLSELLDNASRHYPSLRAAKVEIQAAAEDIEAIRLQRWPTATVTAESNTGNLRSNPMNVLQVQQTIWDFGRISARIAEADAAADISALKLLLNQQDLFLQIISAWQSMLTAREKVKLAETTLERLRAYQAQMRRRVEVEASARIDLELVDARLLQTDVERMTGQTSLQVAITRLEQLSGLESLIHRVNSAPPMPSLHETSSFTNAVNATDLQSVALKAPTVAKERAIMRQAQKKFDGKKSEAWPQIYVRTYKPLSTIPGNTDTSMTTFVGMSYTPGAGLSTLAEAKALETRLTAAQFSVDLASLEMQQVLQTDREEYINARLRISALEKSVEGSELVLASYKRQFEAGKKSWLDLLNAVRELAQNQYNLADAKASMFGAMSRLQLRMGERLQ